SAKAAAGRVARVPEGRLAWGASAPPTNSTHNPRLLTGSFPSGLQGRCPACRRQADALRCCAAGRPPILHEGPPPRSASGGMSQASRLADARDEPRIERLQPWIAALLSALLHLACLLLALLAPPVTMTAPQGASAGSVTLVDFIGDTP